MSLPLPFRIVVSIVLLAGVHPLAAQRVRTETAALEAMRESAGRILERGVARELREEEREVLASRRESLRALLERDPGAALGQFLPSAQLIEARASNPALRELLEEPFSYEGPAEALVADDFAEGRAVNIYRFSREGTVYEAYQEAVGAPDFQCGDWVQVDGFAVGRSVAVAQAKVQERAADIGGCSTTGPQKLAVLLFHMPGTPAPNFTKADVQSLVFGTQANSVNSFFVDNSYGKVSFSGEVLGWYAFDRAYTCREIDAMKTAALRIAGQAVRFADYNRVYLLFAGVADCTFSGLSEVGCLEIQPLGQPASRASFGWQWLGSLQLSNFNGTTMKHELGHSLGLRHSRSLGFPGKPLGVGSAFSARDEYGDRFSTMGGGSGHYAASQKFSLDWLLSGTEVATVTQSGVYSIQPLASQTAGLKALRVRRPIGQPARDGDWVWVEYRQPVGPVEGGRPGESVMFQGAIVRLETSETGRWSDLLNMNAPPLSEVRPVSALVSFPDATLKPGASWSDPHSGLSITVRSLSSAQMEVAVTYTSPCAQVAGIPADGLLPALGGPQMLSVSAPAGCQWNALGNDYWLGAPSGGLFSGSGTPTFQVAATTSNSVRTGSLTLGRQTYLVTQNRLSKPSMVEFAGPTVGVFGAVGEQVNQTVLVSDANGYQDVREIHVLYGASSSQVANSCYFRYQAGSGVSGVLSLRDSAGTGWMHENLVVGSGRVQVVDGKWQRIANQDCEVFAPGWARPPSSYYSEPGFTSFLQLSYDVRLTRPAPNTRLFVRTVDSEGRESEWRAMSDVLRFGSSPGCSISLGQPMFTVRSSAETRPVNVYVNGGSECGWTATSSASWLRPLTMSANASGWVTIEIDGNTTAQARTGTIAFGNRTLTVIQGAAEEVGPVIQPREVQLSWEGGRFEITFNWGGEPFAITQQVGWITREGGTSAPVTFRYTANPSIEPRIGTVTFGSSILGVRQEGRPAGGTATLTLGSASGTAPASAGSGSVLLTVTPGDATWTAVSSAAWLTLGAASGTGSATLQYSYAANPGVSARTGTITVGGQTFTLTQSGATPSPALTLSRSMESAPMGGATGQTVMVAATAGVGWTATSSVNWIVITGGAAGSGNGIVTYTVRANSGVGTRSGVITVGGATLTVTQTGPTPINTGSIAGSGSENTFFFFFTHPEGFGRLGVVNVLINRALDGGRACYLAYSQPLQTLFLVDDKGPEAGLSALALGGTGSVSNSQCAVNAAGSSATTAGTTLVLRLNIEFKAAFAGNQVIYLAAREEGAGGANSGWTTQGAWNVPGAAGSYPRAAGMSPATGRNTSSVITYTYDDQTNANNLETVWALVNTAVDAAGACYTAYYAPGNLLFLYPDNGDGAQATFIELSGTNTIENSQCRISAAGSSVTRSGQRLTVNLNTTFKGGLSGPRGVWTAAKPLTGAASPWTVLGNWIVP